MNRKKICIVSPSLKMGGIERALTVLANYFSEKGFSVSFISCLGGEKFYKLNNEVYVVEPNFVNLGGIKKVFFYIRLLFFLRKEITKINPDVVLSFGDWFNPLVLFSLMGSKYPVFISDRTSPDYNFNVVTKLSKQLLYKKSKGFIAQTKRAAAYKEIQFNKQLNIKIIPNAIREVTVTEHVKENIILYLGRFAWEKAPQRLIEAFSRVENKDNWFLHMAGDGPMLNEMKDLAKRLGISSRIVFHGKVKDVDSLFSKAKIYVLPSVLEGFPNSLCEALSAGLPSICFDTIPFENIIINEKNGFVICDNNIQDLAEKLDFLILNPDRLEKMSQEAIKIKESLSIEKIGEDYIDFLFNSI